MKLDHIVKKGESTKQAYNRLTKARADAVRLGHSTEKLDRKIAFLKAALGVQPVNKEARPSGSRYVNYDSVTKHPMQGGRVSPK